MSNQKITREVSEDGTISVSVTPIVKKEITARWVDSEGVRHYGHTTEKELRALADIPDNYVCVSIRPNTWAAMDSIGPFICHQIRGLFIPPDPRLTSLENLLELISGASPKVPYLFSNRPPAPDNERRMLELSVADPHLGMLCYAPHADLDYDLETAEKTYLWAIENLLHNGLMYGPVEKILFPIGNDYLHAAPTPSAGKGNNYTTTSGVAQPEMTDWHHAYERGERLLIQAIDMLKSVAPVVVLEVSGNHDTYTSFTMARVMRAYYHNDRNVTVDASPNPYKFVHYGCNLIGFKHDAKPNQQVRLAALMANECAAAWAATDNGYREWHIADQHRKGVGSIVAMEEQGVSVEFLPSIVSPNGWHREMTFNHQKRGAMGWVWNYATGPEARIQVNLARKKTLQQMGGACIP
jgi:hypothetical protein